MKFGEKVRELRKKKKMSQTDLAKALGVSLRTITAYEAGHTYPRRQEFYQKMAQVLDTEVNYLRTENEEFMEKVADEYGTRAQHQAKRILDEVDGLLAGGELSPDDQLAFVTEIQEMYLDAKRKAKRFIPKKYLKDDD